MLQHPTKPQPDDTKYPPPPPPLPHHPLFTISSLPQYLHIILIRKFGSILKLKQKLHNNLLKFEPGEGWEDGIGGKSSILKSSEFKQKGGYETAALTTYCVLKKHFPGFISTHTTGDLNKIWRVDWIQR